LSPIVVELFRVTHVLWTCTPGFHFSLIGGSTNHTKPPCLNLLVPSWTLDTRFKFSGACGAVFLLAVAVEGFSKLRHRVVRSAKTQRRQRQQSNATTTTTSATTRLLVTALHGIQALLGYLLMLVTMTFSIELFTCVVAGLATGYAVFFRTNNPTTTTTTAVMDDEDLHMTSNPCCEFMEEESMMDLQQEQLVVNLCSNASSELRSRRRRVAAVDDTTSKDELSPLTQGLLAEDGRRSTLEDAL
jgi:hypothetical protein